MLREDWHSLELEKVITYLRTDREQGLDLKEGKERLKKYGLNKLREPEKIQLYQIFINQFKDFMVLVLLAAACVSGVLGEITDTIAIVAIVILNAILGFIQEYRAEKSLESLKKLTAPQARVARGNKEFRLAAEELVPGDILLLEAGDIIPADARLLDVINLEIDESMLTGESLPVKKNHFFSGQTSLGDRKNMVFSGTIITAGRGKALVVATGMQTEIGKIAELLDNVEEEATPLQKRLEQLGKFLVFICLLVCGLVVTAGVLRGEELGIMFLTGVSLAVAAIPEGLPAIVTIVLAIGVQRMVKRKAVVRRLPSVETLGCANVICSDKTGTLTQNIMTVQKIYLDNQLTQVTGKGYQPSGEFRLDERKLETDRGTLALLLKTAALCNNAALKKAGFSLSSLWRKKREALWGKRIAEWEVLGDPTEGALLVAAAKGNYWRDVLEKSEPRIAELPFDSERKRMTVLCRGEDGYTYAYVKGAPDIIIDYCERILLDGQEKELDWQSKEKIKAMNEEMAGQALRVLALAYRRIPAHIKEWVPERIEKNLIFLGLMGMLDPPREEVREALRLCKKAGIKTVMVTGDHALTAMAIARDIGMLAEGQGVMRGVELDALTEEELGKKVESIGVYARVSPKHKVQIVRAWRKKNYVVGMTGDGVNDAPALKEADIGIAMGKGGTDVTKEASALILMDDNFSTIVAAIEEGRAVYNNIRKFITYLLSCNIGEVLTMFLATLIGLPLPLIPIQILWVNLVTDGLPAMALGVDSSEKDLMQRPPRKAWENIFSGGLGWKIIGRGIQIGVSTVFVFTVALYLGNGNLELARTMTFTTLVLSQLFFVFTCRSENQSIFELGFFSNLYLVGAVGVSLGLLLMALYLPILQSIFQTVPLSLEHWLLITAVSALPLFSSGLGYLWKCLRKGNLTLVKAEK